MLKIPLETIFHCFLTRLSQKARHFFAFLFYIISLIFPIIAILATIFYINPIIGSIVFGLTLAWITFPVFFRKFFSEKIRQQLDSLENLNSEFSEKLNKFEAFLFFGKIHLLKKILTPTSKNASFMQRKYRLWDQFNTNINLTIRKLFLILTDLAIIFLGIYYENPASTIIALVTINSANQLFISNFNTFIVVGVQYLSLKKQFKDSKLNENKPKTNLNFEDFTEKIHKISVKNLNFGYEDKTVLENINFEIIGGKKYLLQGDNGSGKSTFLKILMGIERDYKGEIFFNSTNLKTISDKNIIQNISFIDNSPALIEGNLTENISFYSKTDLEKINDLINLVNLNDLKDKNLINYQEKTDLSVGQKQLINFASHVFETKKILIIDEGFSNLDKSNINNLINWLLEQDVTLLLVLHNLDQNLAEKFDFCLKF
ncbi:ABC transporter ATP-binding protein [Mesomycoplasma ovipneumoniae]|nr:ABC transporter ATP-binding protein [Mesomycoplasma ovipneumoniae]